MSKLRVLIGGEATRTIAAAFEARGHYALTADFRPAQRPGPHHQGDWADVEGQGWDLAIYHRTCTNMANSGAKHLYKGMAKKNGINEDRFIACLKDAWAFWDHMQNCPVKFAAWENPVMLPYAQAIIGKPAQIVQPWWFGVDPQGPDNVKKATAWWVKGGLPKLRPTGILDGYTARPEVHMMAPTADPEERRMKRSNFTPGHAAAIADQWGGLCSTAAFGNSKGGRDPRKGLRMAENSKIEWTPAQQQAARMALCKRLRDTGMQSDDPCDGDIVQCGCCQRTIEAIAKAVVGEPNKLREALETIINPIAAYPRQTLNPDTPKVQ